MNRPSVQMPHPSEMVLAPAPRGIVSPDTARGVATPRLDTEAALMPAKGMAAVGKAIADTGAQMTQLRLKQLEAISIRQEAEADQAMVAAESDMRAEMEREPDETKWASIAEKHVGKVRERIGAMPLAAATKEAVMPKVDRWATHRSGQVQIESARQSFSKARSAIQDKLDTAKMRGDAQAHAVTLRDAVAGGYITQDNAALQTEQFNAAQKKALQDAQEQALFDTIQQDPRKWIAENGKKRPDGMPVPVYERGLSVAHRMDKANVSDDIDRLQNAVASGQITVDAQIDEWEKDNPRLTPKMREQAKAYRYRVNNAQERERIRSTAPEESSALLSELKSIDPEKATDEQMANLRYRIAELPEGFRELPYDRFMRMWRGREAGDKPAASVKEYGDDLLHELFNSGGFGKWKGEKPVFKLEVKGDNAGKWVPAVDENGNIKNEPFRDSKKFQEALKAKAAVGGKFQRWLQRNPKATVEEAQAMINELVPEGTRLSVADAFDPQPVSTEPPKKQKNQQTPAGLGDLPDNPGQMENTLFPPKQ